MAYSCKILADSINPNGDRLTTMLINEPRIIHSEHLRHRMFSFSVQSSRAMPHKRLLEQIEEDPFTPVWWGKNEPGMTANEELDGYQLEAAKLNWLKARDMAVAYASNLAALGLHKQIVNRLLEPWMWTTCIVSGTEWENFFYLRCHPDAQPEIRVMAEMMQTVYRASIPNLLVPGEWHLPFVEKQDVDNAVAYVAAALRYGSLDRPGDQVVTALLKKMSAARCGRVSLLNHEGTRDIAKDVSRADDFVKNGHWSPLEHVAVSLEQSRRIGNFTGFKQYRFEFAHQNYIGEKAG